MDRAQAFIVTLGPDERWENHGMRMFHGTRGGLVALCVLACLLRAPLATADALDVTAQAVRVQPIDPVDGVLPEPWLVQGDTGARSIASISKLTALMVVLDHGLDFEATTTMTKGDHRATKGGARSRLRIGATYSNADLVTAALMSSDNRAVIALGRAAGLSRRQLAAAMVKKAREIGLRRVHFDEPTGISYGNISSAEGIVLTLRAALEYDAIREATSKTGAVITPFERKRPRERYVNTNRLVRWGGYDVIGGKTGFNRKAGHCVTFAMELDGRRVAVVVLGSRTRDLLFRDAKRVARWVKKEARRRKKLEAGPTRD